MCTMRVRARREQRGLTRNVDYAIQIEVTEKKVPHHGKNFSVLEITALGLKLA